MRQTDDYEDHSGGLPLIYMALGVSFFVLLVLVIVVTMNQNKSSGSQYAAQAKQAQETEEAEETEPVVSGSDLVASDLDFWDMYPEEEDTDEDAAGDSDKDKNKSKDKEDEEDEEIDEEEDPSKGGTKTEIILRDGTSEWVDINQNWKKNTYDFTNLVSKNNLLHYYSDGKQVSYLGVDLSRYQKTVDFEAIKNEGIDFCMLRVGARGYESGVIQEDEMFQEYISAAQEAGVEVGLYFYSQAVTEQEAIEEADFVLTRIGENKISYPIAFDMEYVDNDTSRIETLTRSEKTKIALAFLNRIKEAGYTGMLYGDKEWLLKRIDLSQFDTYDIWYAEEADIPDYPYRYSMWQYTRQGEVYGIDGYVDLNISFLDYSAR
jgi:GH25 family lysozyme M1 (1,4-beta-N-acetylmuramidase)